MSSPSLIAVRDDSPMSTRSSPGPRSGGPTSRRTFTPAQKLDHLAAYEAAILRNEGGGYLREQGIYSSQIAEWRKLRDAGVLAGKKPGEKIGRLTAEQAEIARLRRELDKAEQRLATTEVALTIMGKAHELLEQLSKSSRNEPPHTKS
jgi:transposase-like protein